MRVMVGLVIAAMSSGCSVLLVRGPAHSSNSGTDVSCTEERYAPAFDAVSALSSTGSAVYALHNNLDAAVQVGAILAAGAYIASSVYGYQTTNRCADAKDEAYRFHAQQLKEQARLLREILDTQRSLKPVEPVSPRRDPEDDPDRLETPAAPGDRSEESLEKP